MNRRRAIYLKCLDCCGDSWKEVLICQVFDCPLWQFRTGDTIGSARYKRRIRAIFTKKTEDITELQKQGINMADFLTKRTYSHKIISNSAGPSPNPGQVRSDAQRE